MADFNELIKNFDKLRDYMRDFYLFNYKTRQNFQHKSTRTYDNERRRITSYLSEYIREDYSQKGKKISISMESSLVSKNPFFRLYQSKSFTDNDIRLHFFLLDVLTDAPPLTLNDIIEALMNQYNHFFDAQTVRRKLKQYHSLGWIHTETSQKTAYYSLQQDPLDELIQSDEFTEMLVFFSEIAPFGVIGDYINLLNHHENHHLMFKHHFMSNTIDDVVLLDIVMAIEQEKGIEITFFSRRSKQTKRASGYPLYILNGTKTGRRFLVLYNAQKKNLQSYRLDFIKDVREIDFTRDQLPELPITPEFIQTHGTSVSLNRSLEYFEMDICIYSNAEMYIVDRLKREGRGGQVLRLDKNSYRYTIQLADTTELIPWVKSFTGRIIRLDGDNTRAISTIYHDLSAMTELYGGES